MRTRALLTMAIVALLALAACGDDNKSDSSTGADDTTVTAPSATAVTLTADLTGGTSEVPAPGDADGKGSATVKIDSAKGEVCYTITVESIAAPVASHIHEAPAGGAGPILITFDPQKIGKGESCLTGQKAADLDRIVANPAGFYVNVHTADFPGGAVRGQLTK
jgi:hypothetical protein